MSMAFQAFIHRAKIVRSRRPFRSCFEVGGGVDFPEIGSERGPHQSRCELVRGRFGSEHAELDPCSSVHRHAHGRETFA